MCKHRSILQQVFTYTPATLAGVLAVLAGCHADPALYTTAGTSTTAAGTAGDSTGATLDTGTGSGSSGAADSTAGSGDSTGSTGGPGDPEVCAAIPQAACEDGAAPEGPFEPSLLETPAALTQTGACSCLEVNRAPNFELWAPGGWPDSSPTEAPLLLFSHGNGIGPDDYGAVIEMFVSMGFVVANVNVLNPGGGYNVYADDMRCAAEALKAYYGEALRCELVVAGHSQGGTAAFAVAAGRDQDPSAAIFRPFDLRAMVLFAPAAEGGMPEFPAGNALSTLIFAAGNDEQVPGDAGNIYDLLGSEASASPYDAERTLVSIDGAIHESFQGAQSTPALAAVTGYTPEFIRARVFDQAADTWWSYATTQAWPEQVLDDALWSELEPYSRHADVDCSAVLGGCDATPGCATEAGSSDCIDEPRIKTMVAPAAQWRHGVQNFEQLERRR
jgi:pimeloyl-ACP methyl ester carboxylesterase